MRSDIYHINSTDILFTCSFYKIWDPLSTPLPLEILWPYLGPYLASLHFITIKLMISKYSISTEMKTLFTTVLIIN